MLKAERDQVFIGKTTGCAYEESRPKYSRRRAANKADTDKEKGGIDVAVRPRGQGGTW